MAQTNVFNGFGLGKPILTEDLKLNTFPLTSANFTEFVTDRELKRFCVLRLKLSEVIHERDILKLSDHQGKYEPYQLIEGVSALREALFPILPNLLKQIQTLSFMTLWEIWKLCTTSLKITFSIDVLRELLAEIRPLDGLEDLEYYYLNLPTDDDLFASSDGLRVKQLVGKRICTKDDFENYQLCACHLFHNQGSEGDDSPENYDTFDTFAQYSSYSQKNESESNNRWDSMASSLPILTCCDLETCLVPHLIVYKLKYQSWPGIGPQDIHVTSQSKTSTPRKKKFPEKSDVTLDLISSLENIWEDE